MPADGPPAHAQSREKSRSKTAVVKGIRAGCPSIGKADLMTLFVTIHRHAPERCPARDATMGPALLSHLGPATAGQYGVVVHAEAVADSKHTLYLIAEAGDEEQLRRYLAPFAQAGSVEVLPASPCEAVISRGGCTPVPA
jgi:hypothetical protein